MRSEAGGSDSTVSYDGCMAEGATKADIENVVTLLQQNFETIDRRFEAIDRRFEAIDNRLDRTADTLAGFQNQMAPMTR